MPKRGRNLQMSLLTLDRSPTSVDPTGPVAAEFFAGIGLVRMALEGAGIAVAWANDIEPIKSRLYAANFNSDDYLLGDVRSVIGDDIPNIDLATASFPCTDLSLAGWRRGLHGEQSGMFWEFARVLREMGRRKPSTIMLENVPGFLTSHGGKDLLIALEELNELGYICDLLLLNADHFVPQSRARLFIIGSTTRLYDPPTTTDWVRPQRIIDFVSKYPHLRIQTAPIRPPAARQSRLSDVVERFHVGNEIWWSESRQLAFTSSLSAVHRARLDELMASTRLTWRTAYRRTRGGAATWEIRADEIAGCLRTARGGSSKQAIVEAGRGQVRLRWMTGREYARLQGAPDSFQFGSSSPNQVMFGFGDGVCVPAVSWIAQHLLRPMLVSEEHAADRV